VRDAHDRYANLEINYLLQEMENYEGVSILATNFRQNLDEAFLRRVHVVVEFPMPSPEDRERIWTKGFPPETPLAPGLDFSCLARTFDLSGGSIRNIQLAAAFLAAEESDAVSMDHLIRATQWELEKNGKRWLRGGFGPYADLLEKELVRAEAR
jgi:SpoVK/Ycf46/Vps4 family AAA+-type ATPase